MTLVRVLIGVIAALLQACTLAFLALFRQPLIALGALVLLALIAVAISSACGIDLLRRNR